MAAVIVQGVEFLVQENGIEKALGTGSDGAIGNRPGADGPGNVGYRSAAGQAQGGALERALRLPLIPDAPRLQRDPNFASIT